jgi:long-chain fatty acid transport protein
MRRHITSGWVALGALCLVAVRARAGGFNVDEQDARATGRAAAVTADPENASAIYYNPAGIALLEGLHVMVGASWVLPSAEFTAAEGGLKTAAEEVSFVLPQVYVSGRLSEVVALGLGVATSPFGLALDWPATSPGREEVRQAELRTFFITPTLGLQLSRWVPGLSLGAGVDLVPSSVRLTRDILFGGDVGGAALSGEAFGVGARAGVLYRPPALSSWSFGLTYRSPIALDFTGEADFDAPAPYRDRLPPDGDVETSVTLPQTLVLGVLFAPVPEWELEVDAAYRGWSSYDRLDIKLPHGEITSANKDWEDTLTLRVGTEYTFAQRWSARLGFIWDPTPVPATTLDFQLPDADRIDLTAGFGAALSPHLRMDVGVLWVLPQQRSTSMADPLEPPVKGRFDIDAWIVGLSVGMQFDLATASSSQVPTEAWGVSRGAAPPPEAPCRRRPGVRALKHLPGCPGSGAAN